MRQRQFEERQRFPLWIKIVVILTMLSAWWSLVSASFDLLPAPGGPGINWPESRIEAWLLFVPVGVVLPMVFLLLRLETNLERNGVRVRFFPFPGRTIRYNAIESAEARSYRPVREYGGWGDKRIEANRAYSVRGKTGVQLVLRDGSRVLISSERPVDLARAIEDAMR